MFLYWVRNITLPSYCLHKMNNYWTQAPPPAGTGLLCLVETCLVLPRYLHPGCCALSLGGCPCQHEQGGVGPGLIKRCLALFLKCKYFNPRDNQAIDLTNSTLDTGNDDDEVEVFRRTPLWHNLVYKNMVRHLLPVLTSQVWNVKITKYSFS